MLLLSLGNTIGCCFLQGEHLRRYYNKPVLLLVFSFLFFDNFFVLFIFPSLFFFIPISIPAPHSCHTLHSWSYSYFHISSDLEYVCVCVFVCSCARHMEKIFSHLYFGGGNFKRGEIKIMKEIARYMRMKKI